VQSNGQQGVAIGRDRNETEQVWGTDVLRRATGPKDGDSRGRIVFEEGFIVGVFEKILVGPSGGFTTFGQLNIWASREGGWERGVGAIVGDCSADYP